MAGPWTQYQTEGEAAAAPSGPREIDGAPWEAFTPKPLPEEAQEAREVESQRLRTVFQGLTFNFADEIEALARSAVPGSRDYDIIRDEIRQKVDAYAQAAPGEALGFEILGAAAPTAVAMLVPGGQAAGAARGAGLVSRIGRGAGVGAVQGGLSAYGAGEQGGLLDIGNIPAGATIGAGTGGGLVGVFGLGSGAFNRITDYARTKFGDRVSRAVESEVNRLVESTGLTPQEVVDRVAKGQLISENAALLATIRAYRSQPGPTSARITETLPQRTQQTRQEALEVLNRGLTENANDTNTYRFFTQTQDEFRAKESEAYNRIFSDTSEIDSETVGVVRNALNRIPDARNRINEIYRTEGSQPFFRIGENGQISIIRQPTLQDAEIVRRAANEASRSAFREGRGAVGENLSTLERSLRSRIDRISPELATTRQNWANLAASREAFTEGRRSLTLNADEVQTQFERLQREGTEQQIKAFRMGLMDSIRNRSRRSPSLMANLSNPDRNEGAVLRIVFPEDQLEDVLNLTARAGAAQTAESTILRGSMTAPEQTAGRAIGTGAEILQDATSASQGDPLAIGRILQRTVRAFAPELSEAERSQVIDIVMSSDPSLVGRALFDDTAAARMQRLINRVGGAGTAGTRTAAVRQFAGSVEGLGLNVATEYFGLTPRTIEVTRDSTDFEEEEE